MKRQGNLYLKITEPDNLRTAYLKAVRGKRSRYEVRAFSSELEKNLALLRHQLLNGEPEIGRYRFFTVRDPKKREICAASFPERVLHHAVMNICEPMFERYAIYDTYACRKGKGQQKAVLRAQQFCRRNEWYLKLDIRKYFDSVNHSLLLSLLGRLFREHRLLDLYASIFKTYSTQPGKGLPIGNLISQHCANLYLGVLDHWLKDTLGSKAYVRYMDDFLLLHQSRSYLKKLLVDVQHFLAAELDLELKNNIQLNRTGLGIPFLGYRVFSSKILLGRDSKKRFIRKFKKYEVKYRNGDWSEQELARHMEPLVAVTRFADADSFRANVIKRYGVCS